MRETIGKQMMLRYKKLDQESSIDEDGKLLVKIFKETQQTMSVSSPNNTERDKQLVKKAVAFIK